MCSLDAERKRLCLSTVNTLSTTELPVHLNMAKAISLFLTIVGGKQGSKEASVLRPRFGSSEACELQQFFLLEFTQKGSKPGIQQKPVCGWWAHHMGKS